jgi:CRISPR/Cas system CMR-associated protein Cmr5 small subunit
MKFSGKKFTPSHTTAIDAAVPFLDFAHKDASISKITLGVITSIPSRNPNKRIKCTHEKACLLVKIRGNRSIQEFRFFTSEILEFEKKLKKFAKSEGFEIG